MDPRPGKTRTDHDWVFHATVAGGEAQAKPAGNQRRGAAETVSASSPFVEPRDGSDDDMPLPQRLGRFAVLRRLGSGGMGTVLEAYDETLDRRVAVKQLHRDAASEDDGSMWPRQQRLLREAQALARLSHPNVVQVYDAGEDDGRLYIAMELVQGQTLWEWQRVPRPWPEILRVYLDAAQGLAAAHAEGIVHRDFKPTNCLIDDHGRVKVLDFGLARGVDELAEERATPGDEPLVSAEELESSASSARVSRSGVGALSQNLTRTGAMLGTPAYMAPEQAAGLPTDARTDQFSFCVALCEALYGERPFPGNPGLALLGGKEPSLPLKPAGRPPVPKWLRAVLLRGMAAEKEQRFASMDELVAELQRGQRRRRRLWIAALGMGVVLAGGAMATTQREDPCAGLRQAPMPGWTDDERSTVERALSASSVPSAWEATASGLDGYARAWTEARTQACEATHVQHVAGEELLELRMACLDRRALQAQATAALLAEADDGMAARAAQVVRSLPPLDSCLHAEELRSGSGPLPPTLATAAAEIREQVAQSWAFDATGRAVQGLEAAERAVARAKGLGAEAEPLLAEALYNRGRLYRAARRLDEARADLEQVVWLAERGDPALALEAQRELMLVAYEGFDRSAQDAWLTVIGGKLRRADDQPRRQAQLHYLEGLHALGLHDPKRASASFSEAVRIHRSLGEGAELELGQALVELGVAQARQEHWAEAELALEEAQALAERAGLLPLRAEADHERGVMEHGRERYDEAQRWLLRALEAREMIDGPTGAITIPTRVKLARLLEDLGQLDRAKAMAEAARASLGPSVPAASRAQVMSLLARFYRLGGDWDAALESYQEEQEARASGPARDPVEEAMLYGNQADCLVMMKRYEGARELYDRTLDTLRVHLPKGDFRFMYPLFGLGDLLRRQGDRQGAIVHLRRGLAVHEATGEDPDLGANLRWGLGRVLLDPASSPPERDEGLGLVCAALDHFEGRNDASTLVVSITAALEEAGRRCPSELETPSVHTTGPSH